MEPEHRDISATILIEVPNTVMHRFINKEKNLFTTGICKIAKIQNPDQNTVYFINLNSFYYTLNNSVCFIRLTYDDTVSYLFPHFDSGLSSITLLKNSNVIDNFQEILRNTVDFRTWEQAMELEDIKDKIQRHCPPEIEKQPIVCADKIKKLIKDTGKFLGEAFKTIGDYMTEGVKYVGDYIDKKVEEPTEKDDVKPQTKQKWEKLKSGTSKAFDISKEIFNKYLLPVINKGIQYTKEVGTKMETSSNQNIKYARELVGVSGQAINQAFVGLAEGTTKVAGQMTKETRKIVKKKYGDDYVNTFIGSEQEKAQKKELQEDEIKEGDSQETKLYPKVDDEKK